MGKVRGGEGARAGAGRDKEKKGRGGKISHQYFFPVTMPPKKFGALFAVYLCPRRKITTNNVPNLGMRAELQA